MTDQRLLASFSALEGSYEKTTNSWLFEQNGQWRLVTSEHLVDFELEDADRTNTRNVTGQQSSVHAFKKGKFEHVSSQLPFERSFPLQK